MICLEKKRIGIIGFGVVGKAVLRFLQRKQVRATIFDSRQLSAEEKRAIASCGSSLWPHTSLPDFLSEVEVVIPSPGINIIPALSPATQVVSELDLFYAHTGKPIIAVTGTVGKTTITQFLSQLLPPERNVLTGGNIGIGMLDLLNSSAAEYLLELSSFQLELCTSFAPDLAIWTSFFPNHLDRHGTLEAYFQAKLNCLKFQTAQQHALLPLSLYDRIKPLKEQKIIRSTIFYFNDLTAHDFNNLLHRNTQLFNETIFLLNDSAICKQQNETVQEIGRLPAQLLTYPVNWLTISAALHLQRISLSATAIQSLELPEHRGQKVGVWNRISFYNDSKATIMESTIAAVKRLAAGKIILLLGGISKGIDRTPYVVALKPFVKQVVCFGAEAEQLNALLQKFSIPTDAFTTLTEAFAHSTQVATDGDLILLAPGGASFDLYADYQKRGEHFIELVKALAQ